MRGVAVIGCGAFGPHLVRNLVEAGVPQVFVWDPHPERVERVSETHGVSGLPSLDAIWAEQTVQAVVIATPATTHTSLVQAALDAGRHVLVEKPFTQSATEARALVAHAAHQRCILAVDHTALFLPGWAAFARDARDSGARAGVFTREGPAGFRRDTDVLYDLAPHDLALVHDVFGPPEWVSAEADGALTEATLEVGADAWSAQIRVSWKAPTRNRSVELDTGAVFDGLSPATGIEPLRAVVEDFLAAIAHERAPRSDGRLGVQIVEALEAAHTSHASQGARVAIPRD